MSRAAKEIMGSRAIVLGGGIGGLAAAMTLSPHFEDICVIERDRYSEEPSVRKYAPQGAHAHVLLARGLDVLTQMVPELPSWLDDLGLREHDLTRHVHLSYGGVGLPRVVSGIPVRPCTRPIIEHLLLRAARQVDNIRFMRHEIVGLVGSDRVARGVRIRDDGGHTDTVEADWIVGALGRSSRLVDWLKELSVELVREEVVNAGVAYTSCTFRPPPDVVSDWIVYADASRFPDEPEMVGIMQIDQGNWLAILVSYCKRPPPSTVEEFVARVAGRAAEPIAKQIRASTALTRVAHFTNTANRRRWFGKARAWPERLVVLGDAVCSLNPRYGQGMTVAALSASELVAALERHWAEHRSLEALAPRFQRSLERVLDVPWQVATMEDRLWASLMEGRRLGVLDVALQKCSKRLIETVFTDIDTYIKFMRVAHLIESPIHMATPGTMMKIAFPRLRRGSGAHSDDLAS